MSLEPLLNAADVAAMIGKPPNWVKRKAGAGIIPCRRIGRSYAFTEQDVADYIEASKQRGRVVKLAAEGVAPRSRRRSA